VGRPGGAKRSHDGGELRMISQGLNLSQLGQLSQNVEWHEEAGPTVKRNNYVSEPNHKLAIDAGTLEIPEKEAPDSLEGQLDFPPFYEMETWGDYPGVDDVQIYLDIHFPKSRPGTPNEVEDLGLFEKQKEPTCEL